MRRDRLGERTNHITTHGSTAADVKVRVALEQTPQLGTVLLDTMLHVHLLLLRAREGDAEARECALAQMPLELLLVQVVLIWAPAAKAEAVRGK